MSGTQSRVKIIATQSSLEMYIQSKMDAAEKNGTVYTPLKQGIIMDKATHSHSESTQNFSEKIKMGLIKSFGTQSLFSEEKINKGVTPSHPTRVYSKNVIEFKTQSSPNSLGLRVENGKISYSNSKLVKNVQGDYIWTPKSESIVKSPGKNAAMVVGTQSSGLGMRFGNTLNDTTQSVSPKNKFYTKVNSDTKKLPVDQFVKFVSSIDPLINAERMIKSKNVSVNGFIINDIDYILKSGDIVRIGSGHYINGSDLVAIVS